MDNILQAHQHLNSINTLQTNQATQPTASHQNQQSPSKCKNYKLWQKSWKPKNYLKISKTTTKTKIIRKLDRQQKDNTIISLQTDQTNPKKKQILSSPQKYKKSQGFYKVTKIIDQRITSDGKNEYKVRWKGFSPKDDTWEPEQNFDKEILAQLLEDAKNQRIQSPKGNKSVESQSGQQQTLKNKIIKNPIEKKTNQNPESSQKYQTNIKANKFRTNHIVPKPRPALTKCSKISDSIKQISIISNQFCNPIKCENKKNSQNLKNKEMEALETMNLNSQNSFEHQKQQKIKNNQNLYELKDIISRRKVIHKGKKTFRYRIRWEGYSPKDDTWEYAQNLSDIDVEKFNQSLISPEPQTQENLQKQKKCKDKFNPLKFCKIVDDRLEKGKKLFKIHWKGYSSKEDTWEPITNFNYGSQLLFSYEKKLGKVKKDIGILKTMTSLRQPMKRETLQENDFKSEISQRCSNKIDEQEHAQSLNFSQKNLSELLFLPNFVQIKQRSQYEQQEFEYKEISQKQQIQDENQIWKYIEN